MWAGIWGQKVGQDLGPPAWDPTVRYQAGGPRWMPGNWPHFVGPPNQPGEGGGRRGDTHRVFGLVSTRWRHATRQPRNTRGCQFIQGPAGNPVIQKLAVSRLMQMQQQGKHKISGVACNRSNCLCYYRT